MGFENWERIYREHPMRDLPGEIGRPKEGLIEIIDGGLVRPGRALDLCCGSGINALYLAQKGFDVAAIDITPTAIDYAQKLADEAKVRIDFAVGNYLDLPFGGAEFDFLFDPGCFNNVQPEERDKFIDEIHRVLKPDGMFLTILLSYQNGPGWNNLNREQIEELFHPRFEILQKVETDSINRDGVTRYFYSVLMRRN